MPNYMESKIYKIECNITKQCYIGSTTEPTLERRLSNHVHLFMKWKKGYPMQITSSTVIGRGDYDIHLIELYPCHSKHQLLLREGQVIRDYKLICNCVNKKIEGRTTTEKKELYNHQNYYKEYMMEYRKNNKEKSREYNKNYYELNKEKSKEKLYTKCECECGGKYIHVNKSHHNKSKKHLKYLESLEQ